LEKESALQIDVAQFDDKVPQTVIDPNGDVVLDFYDSNEVRLGSCLVSTKVLNLACPVFARMFRPGFEEGEKIIVENCPTIPIRGDKFSPMEMILKVLHYQGDIRSGLTADTLTELAIVSDKYDCVKALGPWVTLWFDTIQHGTDRTKEFGYLILAAYLFRDDKHFKNISQKAILQLIPDFASQWDLIDLLGLLPSRLPGKHKRYAHIEKLTKTRCYLKAHLRASEADAKRA
jgi:hypothetical protein